MRQKSAASSISVIIPAYNEAGNIEAAVKTVLAIVKAEASDVELIIVNDGSTDATAAVINRLVIHHSSIRVMTMPENRGLGYAYKQALPLAKKAYMTVFPGDNDMSGESLKDLIRSRAVADIVLAYMQDSRNRSLLRRLLSTAFVVICNRITGLNLRYYNGPFICRTEVARRVKLRSDGLAVFAEMKIAMIRSGCSFVEIPFHHVGRKTGTSKALTVKTLLQTARTMWILVKYYT